MMNTFQHALIVKAKLNIFQTKKNVMEKRNILKMTIQKEKNN